MNISIKDLLNVLKYRSLLIAVLCFFIALIDTGIVYIILWTIMGFYWLLMFYFDVKIAKQINKKIEIEINLKKGV